MQVQKALHRLRPLELEAVKRLLHEPNYLWQALNLIHTYFPGERIAEFRGACFLEERKWVEVVDRLYQITEEEDFFKVDWGLIQHVTEYWTQTLVEGITDGELLFALFLKYLPVETFGFTCHHVFDFPVVSMLTNLFHEFPDSVEMPLKPLIGLTPLSTDEYPEIMWSSDQRATARTRIETIRRNPAAWPEPVRRLDDFVRWCCGASDNIILDYAPGYDENPWPWTVLSGAGEWFTWAEHFEIIKQDWRKAKPIVMAFREFLGWCEEANNLSRLFDFIISGKPL